LVGSDTRRHRVGWDILHQQRRFERLTRRMTTRMHKQFSLLGVLVISGVFAVTPAFANWWIVRSSDETCLVVDIEPTGKEKGVTKIGRESYPTAKEAEADVKRLCKSEAKPKQNP
jgi:hypothetical protein